MRHLMARTMSALRAFLRDHRRLALAALALAFAVRALVPAGFMVAGSGTTLTISICADSSGATTAMKIVIPAKDNRSGKPAAHAPCAFAANGHPALAGTDPVLLALAIAFILVLGLAPARTLPALRAPYLLPPLRGPPART